ncbi:MAG: AAA domain-containing protein [Bacillus sp. (in: firmicutes)]
MEKSSLFYIKEWQKALQAEIAHLKNYGSKKYHIVNGRKLSGADDYTYYFDCHQSIAVPNGSIIKLQYGEVVEEGRILSSEGKGIILCIDRYVGDTLSQAYLMYDPWQLLDELATRLDEIKKSKKKRARMKRLLHPDMPDKHPKNEEASHVKELYVRSKYNPVTYVWGPPGTGKTYTLARVAANKYLKKQKVLILAQSNAAVDVIMTEIYLFLKKAKKFKEGDILRYGSQNSTGNVSKYITISHLLEQSDPGLVKEREQLVSEKSDLKNDLYQSFSSRDSHALLKLETKLASVLEKMKRKESKLVKDAQIIGTTLAKAATDPTVYETEYDLVIVDEASMCYVPQAAFAASLGKRVIICGDFKQLPPIAQSKHRSVAEWLKEDIFHKSGVAETVHEQLWHPHLLLLNEQRRMHPHISSFTNKYIYHSLVHDHESVAAARYEIVEREPFAFSAAISIDTSFTGHYCINEQMSQSRWNPWHLFLSFQLIIEAYAGGSRSIGYVTPYRVQAEMMNYLLEDFYPQEKLSGHILASTVHKFQGSEKEVIIFDTVDTWPQARPGMLLVGKESERLINVAVTRTKGKFICVNNREYTYRNIGQKRIVRKLIEHQHQYNTVVAQQQIGTWVKHQHKRLKWLHAKKEQDVWNDMQMAKKRIILSLPEGRELRQEYQNLINKLKRKVDIIIISTRRFGQVEMISENLPFPFIVIDDEYLWLGQPFELSKGVRAPYVAVKVCSKLFVGQFLSHLPLEQTIK